MGGLRVMDEIFVVSASRSVSVCMFRLAESGILFGRRGYPPDLCGLY